MHLLEVTDPNQHINNQHILDIIQQLRYKINTLEQQIKPKGETQ